MQCFVCLIETVERQADFYYLSYYNPHFYDSGSPGIVSRAAEFEAKWHDGQYFMNK